ncbi:endonuclease/exonuclease/phosphatase family protein [Nibrella saemangeumensis]|uniref:Endonuclease/exonuclease/phosphatase family protein n=1 Tax=Nibrella saemangeumensis TaxID=1084526 RepID=A0ABP8N766_9BACT
MKLLNWNICHGGAKNLNAISEAIAKHNPDVVVLTEFRNGMSGQQLLKNLKDLGLEHHTKAEALPNDNSVVIASRWIGTDALIEVPAALQKYVTATKIGDVTIIGTFCAREDVGKNFFGFLSALQNGYRPKLTLATGDFYFGPKGSNPRNYNQLQPLWNAGWKDIWKRDNPDKTLWSYRSSAGGVSRPDHIVATEDLAPRIKRSWYSLNELDNKLSDHAPMLAEID